MMRSMYAAVGGLRNHQTRMDVIGNNIANVNTVAFKSSRVTFQDVFYQTISGGSAPTADRGGINPKQVGVGMALNSIDTNLTQGNVQPTGIATDIMIQGDGYFVLSDAAQICFSRAGVFGFDSAGNLINKNNGMFVQNVNGGHITIDPDAQSFQISSDGYVTFIDSTGALQGSGDLDFQIAVAKFTNPEGLLKVGENLFQYDTNAGDEVGGAAMPPAPGDAVGGAPGADSRGTLVPGSLEMSNVELAQEFTDMITTQRGFQANARTITTSDEMLQELVNLKR